MSQFTVPPGTWRVGKTGDPGELILMRFATVDDVKTPGAQRKSHYYREHGNPKLRRSEGLDQSIVHGSSVEKTAQRRRGNWIGHGGNSFATDLRKTITDKERWTLLREDARRNPELEPGELVEEEDLETGEVRLMYSIQRG